MPYIRFSRLILGAGLLALFWGFFAWLASGTLEASFLAIFISLVLGPVLIPFLLWNYFRIKKRLVPEDLTQNPILRDLVLRCVLHRSVLNIKIWILEDQHDEGFIWYEHFSILKRQNETRVVITRAWLNRLLQNYEQSSPEFECFWGKIDTLSKSDRILRSLQIRFWMGSFLILEILLKLLDVLVRFFGIHRMPPSVFWCQGWALQISSLWLGTRWIKNSDVKISQHALCVDSEPLYWKSLLLGVWSYYPTRVLHPTWRLLTRDEFLLENLST